MGKTVSKSASKKVDKKTTKIKRGPTARQIEKQVREVLVELLGKSESDTVRVAAAKALMDRIDKSKSEKKATNKKVNKNESKSKEEREHAIEEAKLLLAEITRIKSCGLDEPCKMD